MATTLTATFQLIDEMSDKLANIAENGSNAASQFEKIGDSASAAESSATSAATQTAKSVDNMGESFAKSGKQAESSGSTTVGAIQTVAGALAAAGIVKMVNEFTGALLECSDVAAQFETAMLKVSTVADTTEVPLSDLTAGIKNLSQETGKSTGDLSEALYQALSASVDTADAIEFTATATKLATGGFTSTKTAVDVLTTALNAYGLEASKASDISDILITTQNLGKTTVDELASSMGKVIPIASAYGVQMDQLGAAYAEMTKNGISTRIATTELKSMFDELGDSGSTVAGILLSETGQSFSQLMDSGRSLGDVLEIIGSTVDGDAGAFNELWSSSTAAMAALTLFNSGSEQFNSTLAAMQDSAGATSAAFETMTDSTQHAKEEMSNAATNLQSSIGSVINPMMEKLYSAGAKVLNVFVDFVDEHPIVVQALTAIAIGMAAVVAVVTTVSVIIPIVTTAVQALGAAFNAALGPIGWVAAGITAVVAAGAAFVAMINSDTAEYNTWTASTKTQYDALQELTKQYEEACAVYGETSEEASRLRYQVDDATAAFEASKQTIEQFTAEVDNLCQSVAELTGTYADSMATISNDEKGTMALIQKYADLASQADLTAAEQKQLDAVTKSLSNSYPDVIESLDKAGASTDAYVEAMRNACEQEAEQQRLEQSQDTYVQALQKRAELTDEIAKTEAELAEEQARMNDMSGWEHFWTANEWDGVNAYTDALDDLNAAMAENDAMIASIEGQWADLAEAEATAATEASSYEEAVSIAYNSVKEEVDKLCQAYDEAYQAALDSFTGQFGLFDEAQANMDASVEAAQAALDSQLEYWTQYGENVERLKSLSAEDLGITQESYENLMSYVQDGSEEAAGLAASMVEAIEEGNTEAISTLANTMEEVTAKQEEVAAATADWQTNFTSQMQEYAAEMESIVTNDLELSDEASAAATSTINAYADSILAGKGAAVAAAQEVASAVSNALSSANATLNVKANISTSGLATGSTDAPNMFVAGEKGPELVVPAHAAGTTEGEPYYLAGEKGPELIVGQEGSTVFPTSETDRIIQSINAQREELTFPEDLIKSWSTQAVSTATSARDTERAINDLRPAEQMSVAYSVNDESRPLPTLSETQEKAKAGEEIKHIVIELAGSGAIDIGSNTDVNAVLDLLQSNLKPVLLNILQEEIFEEGDLSYEY